MKLHSRKLSLLHLNIYRVDRSVVQALPVVVVTTFIAQKGLVKLSLRSEPMTGC